mgnify:CR=1 FL=1
MNASTTFAITPARLSNKDREIVKEILREALEDAAATGKPIPFSILSRNLLEKHGFNFANGEKLKVLAAEWFPQYTLDGRRSTGTYVISSSSRQTKGNDPVTESLRKTLSDMEDEIRSLDQRIQSASDSITEMRKRKDELAAKSKRIREIV